MYQEDYPPGVSGQAWVPWLSGLALTVVLALAVAGGFKAASPEILHYSSWDVYFESDPAAIFDLLKDRLSRNHHRSSHHALFSLILFPAFQALRAAGLAAPTVAGVLMVSTTAAWSFLVFFTCRCQKLGIATSAVITLAAAATSSSVFWLPVLESHAFGALTVIAAVACVATQERGRPAPYWVLLLVAILTLGITTTNAVWGLLMLAATMSRRRALLTAGAAFSLVWILWYMGTAFFPASDSFLKLNTPSELMYIMNPDSLGLLAKLRAFAFHSIVLPEIELVYGFRLSVQGSRVLQDSLVGTIALLAWISLLALAVSALRKIGTSLTLKVLGLGTLSQAVLAASFGVETFSYSANWTTALVLLVGLLAIKRSSRGGASILVLLVLSGGAHNVRAFLAATEMLQERYRTEKELTEAILATTRQTDSLICGRESAAAFGERAPDFARDSPPERDLGQDDPSTCFFQFTAPASGRWAWAIPFELWSTSTLDALHDSGATHFVTSYSWGMEKNPGFAGELEQRHTRIAGGENWWIYRLEPRISSVDAPSSSLVDEDRG